MNPSLLLLAQTFTMPAQAATVVKFGIYIVLLISVAFAIIKVIKGIHALERGEEGKMGIVAGVLTPCAVFLVIGVFQAVGLWTAMGITFP